MKNRNKIFNYLKSKIKSIEQISSTGLNRPGKDNTFYEHLSIILENGKKETFLLDRSRGFCKTYPTTTKSLNKEELPLNNSVFYEIMEWICIEYCLNDILLILKHLKAFEKGISLKEWKIQELKKEIYSIEKHLERNLFYWSCVEKISSYEVDRKYDNKITEIDYSDGTQERNIGGRPGVEEFENYRYIDSNMCHIFETSFMNKLKWKDEILIPKEFNNE